MKEHLKINKFDCEEVIFIKEILNNLEKEIRDYRSRSKYSYECTKKLEKIK